MSIDIIVPQIFITRLHTETPVSLRIFVWYFKIFIPRQHSPFLPLPFCRFAVLSIFCRCRLTWYILCQAILYGRCIIIPLSCPQNLSHDAVLVFICPVHLLLVLQADDQDNTRCPSAVTGTVTVSVNMTVSHCLF